MDEPAGIDSRWLSKTYEHHPRAGLYAQPGLVVFLGGVVDVRDDGTAYHTCARDAGPDELSRIRWRSIRFERGPGDLMMTNILPRIVAVDYGTKRVGLAMTDPLRIFAQAVGTFTPDGALARLFELHASDGLATIVVGWPISEDGEEGKATRRVEPFLGQLKNRFRDVVVVRQDERHSSKRAVEALVAAGVTKSARRDKGRIDAAAAVLILQDYLSELEYGGGAPRIP